jgi:hypothetical protein
VAIVSPFHHLHPFVSHNHLLLKAQHPRLSEGFPFSMANTFYYRPNNHPNDQIPSRASRAHLGQQWAYQPSLSTVYSSNAGGIVTVMPQSSQQGAAHAGIIVAPTSWTESPTTMPHPLPPPPLPSLTPEMAEMRMFGEVRSKSDPSSIKIGPLKLPLRKKSKSVTARPPSNQTNKPVRSLSWNISSKTLKAAPELPHVIKPLDELASRLGITDAVTTLKAATGSVSVFTDAARTAISILEIVSNGIRVRTRKNGTFLFAHFVVGREIQRYGVYISGKPCVYPDILHNCHSTTSRPRAGARARGRTRHSSPVRTLPSNCFLYF